MRAIANKPHYLHRPSQVLKRLRFDPDAYGPDTTLVVDLPWGAPIEVWPADPIGSSIMRSGIYDLLVSEVLLRLSRPGGVAIDAGANIGQMSAVMALGCGPTGRVLCFEPHPQICAVLGRNVGRWNADRRTAAVELHQAGLSDVRGTAQLRIPHNFAANRGISHISAAVPIDHDSCEVNVVRLDDLDLGQIDLMKLDVEGHEAEVLAGAHALLESDAIRHLVFEEHGRYPTPVTDLLQSAGFEILGLKQRLRGPALVPPAAAAEVLWDPPALLATREPEQVQQRLSATGWRVLRAEPGGRASSG